jgi:hypothetical protein
MSLQDRNLMNDFHILRRILVVMVMTSPVVGDCPLDHLLIGCNEDGVRGTKDDTKLFVERSQKYRHSDPNNPGESTWLNHHYPMYYNERYDRYQIGEPGFDTIKGDDPNRQLVGIPNVNYRIIVQCISVTPGFSAKNTVFSISMDKAGDWFNHSSLEDTHVHLQYRAPAPAGKTQLHWITYQLYDDANDAQRYEPSEPFTVVFVREPLAGDLVVDGVVNLHDIAAFSHHWLSEGASPANDFFERADMDRNGTVDFSDFALLATNWLKSLQSQQN